MLDPNTVIAKIALKNTLVKLRNFESRSRELYRAREDSKAEIHE